MKNLAVVFLVMLFLSGCGILSTDVEDTIIEEVRQEMRIEKTDIKQMLHFLFRNLRKMVKNDSLINIILE